MPTLPRRSVMIPVRSISRLPMELRPSASLHTVKPNILGHDETIFAFFPPRESVFSSSEESIFYASTKRDPVRKDTVLVELHSGESFLRSVVQVRQQSYLLVEITNDFSNVERIIEFQADEVPFASIKAISVVVMMMFG